MGLRTTTSILKNKDYPNATQTWDGSKVVFKSSSGTVLAYATPTEQEKTALIQAWQPAPPPPPPVPMNNRGPWVSPNGSLFNYNISSSNYIAGFRFVGRGEQLDAWYWAAVIEGSSLGGRTGYSAGNGGYMRGRIVEANAAGLPDLSKVKAIESNPPTAIDRWRSLRDQYQMNLDTNWHGIMASYFDFPFLPESGRMYWFLLDNIHSSPGDGGHTVGNHTSIDTLYVPLSQMGPHKGNNLDEKATGALFGCDPRETCAWSSNAGSTWDFGDRFGQYSRGSGYGRMWHSQGYRRTSDKVNVPVCYPWNIDPTPGIASVTFTAPESITLTKAGACASGTVGTVTVENLQSRKFASTSGLGSGVQEGQLSSTITVAAGEQYKVSCIYPVERGEGHRWRVFRLGESGVPGLPKYTATGGSGTRSMPSLYAK